VVGEHGGIRTLNPRAPLDPRHRRIASQAVRAGPILLTLVVALVAGCGGDTSAGTDAACRSVEAPDPRDPGSREAPSTALDADRTYTLTFETSCGSFVVTLDPETAPRTTASLVALARDGYFDDTIFHRVARGFVIQGGDPTQSGGGGPGYSTVDLPPSDARYTKGVVAMAKAATEAPGTGGSQFFVVTGEDVGLPSEYAIVGTVTAGMGTVEAIDALGGRDGPPSQPVVVDSVTVSES
jgi:cyclophilin family peptidyl-prolyl cis-trans isomerase